MFLQCHTYYSLRYGVLSPAELVAQAQRWGVSSLALTDINNTSCAVEFVDACTAAGIKPVLGIDFRDPQGRQLYIGLARNESGWESLNRLLSDVSRKGIPLSPLAPPMEHVWIIYPRLIKPISQFRQNERLGIRPEHVARLFNHDLLHHPEQLCALYPVTFTTTSDFELHRRLRAIDKNTLLDKVLPSDCAKKTELLIAPESVAALYQQYPFLIANAHYILDTCTISLPRGLGVNRQVFTDSKDGDFELLQKLAFAGLPRRYSRQDAAAAARTRVLRELEIIRQHNFCAYFLITWDIIRYAQSVGYHHVGRGSGANSIVAYCLGITDVDPLELDLYFERFINPYRVSPPDFDIDFSWDERDDITDYIFKRYGEDRVALLATYSTFQRRAALRELGKVYGLPKEEIDRLVDGEAPWPEPAAEIQHYAAQMDGFPNHLSIHAGGVLIAERSLYAHTALQQMPKGFPVTHVDMYHAELLGFHKFDILSQRGLGHIKEAVELIYQNRGLRIDVHDIERLKTDAGARALLQSGHCMGCFYIESPAMRALLQKLRCADYVHLVAASSIIRPGVARSGMMREYIRRFHQPYSFEYLHPLFETHLKETFGIMVYQEDVMKIVHHFAGLDLEEGDMLRRIMSGKKFKDDTPLRLKEKYMAHCRKQGYSEELTRQVWTQIESFSGYSFCKAHSASYAAESFQSLFLKAHYPLEFMVAVINNFGGFYHTEYYLHEARMAGASIHAPCVNHSTYLSRLQGTDLYLGFIHLLQMNRDTIREMERQRTQGGPFRSLDDFVLRVPIHTTQLELLIRIGAFRFTGKNKYELMWEKSTVFQPGLQKEAQARLFSAEELAYMPRNESAATPVFSLPTLEEGLFDQAFDELELLGFPLCSPFSLLVPPWNSWNGIRVADLSSYLDKPVQILGYYVCQKPVRTINGQRMAFGTWLDIDGYFFDTTHFPNFLQMFPFRGKGVYHITGKVVEEYGFYSLEVIRMERLPFIQDARFE